MSAEDHPRADNDRGGYDHARADNDRCGYDHARAADDPWLLMMGWPADAGQIT
jgi:hypothetical protein